MASEAAEKRDKEVNFGRSCSKVRFQLIEASFGKTPVFTFLIFFSSLSRCKLISFAPPGLAKGYAFPKIWSSWTG
jgi:hypothetical protein